MLGEFVYFVKENQKPRSARSAGVSLLRACFFLALAIRACFSRSSRISSSILCVVHQSFAKEGTGAPLLSSSLQYEQARRVRI